MTTILNRDTSEMTTILNRDSSKDLKRLDYTLSLWIKIKIKRKEIICYNKS